MRCYSWSMDKARQSWWWVVFSLMGLILVPGRVAGATDQEIFKQAVQKLVAGDYKGAKADTTRVIEINPQADDAYALRGSCEMQLHESDAALADFNRALELNPDNIHALGSRGYMEAGEGMFEGSTADYLQISSLIPTNPAPYFFLGLVKERQRQWT